MAIETVFPRTQVQLCLMHMVRNSLQYVSWKQRKEVATDLKTIYQTSAAEQTGTEPGGFREEMGGLSPLHRSILAKELGTADTVLCLPARNSQSDLEPRFVPQ